ncbi:MAG TPA: outer membrane protein [Xanthobacteraceae bacterium]|nr:outer membrane protein [Xanthobacteraceae bacterium]
MKKLLFAGVVAVAFSGASAFATDMPSHGPFKAPPIAPFSWTGCYFGMNAGGGWSHSQWVALPAANEARPRADGFAGGGQVGCDYQTGNWVFGIEGMLDGASLTGTQNDPLAAGIPESDKVRWFGTVIGRVGYAWDRVLLYAKGGVAWIDERYTINLTAIPLISSIQGTSSGWVAGAGIEWSYAPQWSVKLEYDHLGLDSKTGSFPGAGLGPFKFKDQSVDTVLVGLNYRFNGR